MTPFRLASLVLPGVAVAVVAVALLGLGRPRAVVAARLRGGPTEGATVLSWRLEVVQRLGDTERAVALRGATVQVRFETGTTAGWHGRLDDEGAAAVTVSPPSGVVTGPVQVRVELPGSGETAPPQLIADALVSVPRAAWAGAARRRGGWVQGHPSAGLTVRVAAARGVFAVPFRDPLWVEVRREGGSLASVSASATGEGGQLVGGPIVPSEHPRTQLFFTPTEHAASVSVVARAADGAEARDDVSLAVVPGALHAALSKDGLVVLSPVVRERAYVAVVSESERIAGGTVPLTPDGRGGARGVLAVPALPDVPLWAVVSSEPDLHSAALVGWPLDGHVSLDAPMTFDVPDVLVVDSVHEAEAREASRVRRVRAAAAAFAALSLALTALFVVRGAAAARKGLEAHLDDAGADRETTRLIATSGGGSTWLVVAAVLTLALAALLVAVFALWE